MKKCIFCGSTNLINTGMAITLVSGLKIEAELCNEHAESESLKSIKSVYEEKYAKLDEYVKILESFGYTVFKPGTSVTLAVPPKPPATPSSTSNKHTSPIIPNSKDMIPTEKFESVKFNPIAKAGDGVPSAAVQALSPEQLSDKLPHEALKGQVKVGVATGREGVPIAFQEKRIDGTGTTTISIEKRINDKDLQESFKRLSKESMSDDSHNFARSGYTTTTKNCPVCRSQGMVKDKGADIICPKCQGAGVIDF